MKKIFIVLVFLAVGALAWGETYKCPYDECRAFSTGMYQTIGMHTYMAYRCSCCGKEYLILIR